MEHKGDKERKQSVGLAFRFACGQFWQPQMQSLAHAPDSDNPCLSLAGAANTEAESNVLKSPIKV